MKTADKGALRAGAARVEITPRPGIHLTGFIARAGPSLGIHDPLYARALALEAGGQRVVLVACDLLALDAAFVSSARTAIHAATGAAHDHILIACTHTHSGPATIFLRDCGVVDDGYLDDLRSRLADAAAAALADLRLAQIGVGQGAATGLAFNRRVPEAPIDEQIGVAALRDLAGKAIATLVNYACHPVCLDHRNRLLSADYPGFLAQALEEHTGAPVLFTNGACGDINPRRMGGFDYVVELGAALAAEARAVVDGLAFQDAVDLRAARETLDLPLQPLPARFEIERQIREYRRQLAQVQQSGGVPQDKPLRAMLGWAEAAAESLARGGLPQTVPLELQVIRLGDLTLAGVAGELFNELGARIKQTASRPLWVVGYANGDIGYIPTRQAYTQGGYEIDAAYKYYGYPAALAPEAGERLVQAAERLVKRLDGPPAAVNGGSINLLGG